MEFINLPVSEGTNLQQHFKQNAHLCVKSQVFCIQHVMSSLGVPDTSFVVMKPGSSR